MTRRNPDPGSEFEEEGIPDLEGPLPSKEVTGDPQEGLAVPSDAPQEADRHGTTAGEQREGATIESRLREEEDEPDSPRYLRSDADEWSQPGLEPEDDSTEPFPEDTEERSGRLVEEDEGARSDTEKDTVARDAGTDRGGFAPEERAVHVERE